MIFSYCESVQKKGSYFVKNVNRQEYNILLKYKKKAHYFPLDLWLISQYMKRELFMKKNTFSVIAFAAAGLVILNGFSNIVDGFALGFESFLRIFPVLMLSSLSWTLFAVLILSEVFFTGRPTFRGMQKKVAWICLIVSASYFLWAVYLTIRDLILPALKNYEVFGKSYKNTAYFSQALMAASLVLICICCIYKIFGYRKYGSIFQYIALAVFVGISVLSVQNLLSLRLILESNLPRYLYPIITNMTKAVLFLFAFKKRETVPIKANRQFGFIAASIGVIFLCFVGQPHSSGQIAMRAITLFPLLVFCLTNVGFDLFLAGQNKNEQGSILYEHKTKVWIFAVSAVINLLICVCILSSFSSGDYGGLVILYSIATYLVTYIVFSIAMNLGWTYVFLFGFLPFILGWGIGVIGRVFR